MRIEAPCLAAMSGVRHGFFGRQGGVSRGAFASLNVSLRNADDPDNAIENRRRVVAAIDMGEAPLLIARQVHGTECAVVEAPFDPRDPPAADALASRTHGLVLGVTTADCAPILMADAGAGVIAAAHAGWRGAQAGIIEATFAAALRLGATPATLACAIGPCIGQASYEVGAAFEAAFLTQDAQNDRFFRTGASGRPHFDLAAYCAARLAAMGVTSVDVLGPDTCADSVRFFSYRRATLLGERDFGLQVAAIGLV